MGTSRPDSADYQGNQENPRTLGTQNETPRCRSLPETENVTPQNTGAISRTPNVVPITDQNRHLVRDDLGGHNTSRWDPEIHTTRPTQTPECVRALDGHPLPSDLNLGWTHTGEWAKIPKERNARIHEDTPHEIVRVESYIDEEGLW